ncbi:MAG: glycyl-radical enzyme activating protein [Ruminococcaceae bacterium]|nr:glycyl-radical enzyme activating protein [Oscillospiraceae bacterium]
MKARVADIKRFAVHDGDGIRTTVFFKGCPLSCVWCHNPETIAYAPQTAYYENKCIGCMECAAVCPGGAHRTAGEGHGFDREKCVGCGACEEACLGEALKFYGQEMTVEELLPRLLEDRAFYENSGGGVTLSGGECLTQGAFCEALLRALQSEGIHTAVDTCGFVSRETLERVMPCTDIFLYDIKAIDPEVHKRCTGQDNGIILDNLRYLNACGKTVDVRIPYVPGYNAGEMEKIRDFLATLSCVRKITVLAYHNYAGSKYASLGMDNTLPPTLPTTEEVAAAQAMMDAIVR